MYSGYLRSGRATNATMIGSQGPKDNANPTVRIVEKDRSRARRQPLQWTQLGDFRESPFQLSSPGASSSSTYFDRETQQRQQQEKIWLPTTAEDRSLLNALVYTSSVTKGKGVALLTNLGLVIPSSTPAALKQPYFRGAEVTTSRHLVEEQPQTNNSAKTIEWEKVTPDEVFDIIRNIQDPEHPHTLEQLGVVCLEHVEVNDEGPNENKPCTPSSLPPLSTVSVRFTPTIPHCSMATLIGLCIRVKLMRSLPSRFKISVQIQPGTHASENAINKQLRDKERVCAALENKSLAGVVNKCIKGGMMMQYSQ